jgi:Glycosyl transferases group 1
MNYVLRGFTPDPESWAKSISGLPWIRYHPRLPNSEVLELMHSHDVLVFPSFDEILGWVVVEAGLASMPSITSNVYALPELISEGLTGYVVKLAIGDDHRWKGIWAADSELEGHIEEAYGVIWRGVTEALSGLFHDRSKLNELGEAARARMNLLYNPDLAGQALDCIYDDAAGGTRAPKGLKVQQSRGPLIRQGCSNAAVEDVQVQHGRCSPDVEEVLASAAVACASPLPASQMSQTMFNGNSFAQAFTADGSGHELAQLVLKQFIVGDGDSPSVARGCRGALGSQPASRTRLRVKFHVSAKVDGLDLASRTGDGPVAHVDLEIGLGEELAVARDPRLANDIPAIGEHVTDDRTGDVAAVDVHLGNPSALPFKIGFENGRCHLLGPVGRCHGASQDQVRVHSVSRARFTLASSKAGIPACRATRSAVQFKRSAAHSTTLWAAWPSRLMVSSTRPAPASGLESIATRRFLGSFFQSKALV